MELLSLCWEFFKTGLFAVGGGMATIPFLTQMSQTHPNWFTMEMLANMIAVGESTPGPIGVNMATYAGYTVAGVLGGILATLSLVLPSLLVILLIAGMLERYQKNRLVMGAFSGLRPAVTGLIAAAGYTVLQSALLFDGGVGKGWLSVILLAAFVFCLQTKKGSKLHPILYIGIAAVCGIAFSL